MRGRRSGALHVVVAGVDHFVAVGAAARTVVGFLDEPGGEDRRREREQPDTEDSDDGAQQFPERGDGVDIAVADGRQRRDPPPVRRRDRGERLGLGPVLDEVHHAGGDDEEQSVRGDREDQLLAFRPENPAERPHRLGVAGEFEQAEKVDESERAEESEVDPETHPREEEGKDREQSTTISGRVANLSRSRTGRSVPSASTHDQTRPRYSTERTTTESTSNQ